MTHLVLKHDLVLFDFDGTLADSIPWLAGATERLAREFRFRMPPPEEIEQLRGGGPASILSGMKIPMWKMPRIAAAMRRMMAEEIATIRLFEGMEAFFHRLEDRGVQLGIVSSNSESNIRTVLGAVNARFFRHYECGVSLLGKAAKLRRAARKADFPIDRTLYVGDEIRDLDAADKAGMPFAGVAWGFATIQAFQKRNPRAVFRTIEEMSDYLTSP